jgi:ppGpp synthetase/RelA/SpoT-type nucleotidyltranferase
MNEEEYLDRFRNETPMLEAWGQFIIEKIDESLSQSLGEKGYKSCVKIPPSIRVKEAPSLITKAFVLNRGWFPDKYNDITDKVGVRYVVGLTDHISFLANIITESHYWGSTSSKEFDEWRNSDPRLFDYQSAHFILSAVYETIHNGITIPIGTKCEVQIRTLLQHAYAELSHDTLYKTNIKRRPEIHRLFAKSMALMEATDDMLSQAKSNSNKTLAKVEDVKQRIISVNRQFLPSLTFEDRPRENDFLIDSLANILPSGFNEQLPAFLKDTAVILNEKISKRQKTEINFQIDAITLVYFLAKKKRHSLPDEWPFDVNVLNMIYSDLGITPPGSSE